MKLLELTLPSPQENLACDEALLEACEQSTAHEVLRFWEPREHFVVLGYSSRISSDVKLSACNRLGLPLFRRDSGGGTVLQGPGCLNFSLVLRMARHPRLASISGTTSFPSWPGIPFTGTGLSERRTASDGEEPCAA